MVKPHATQKLFYIIKIFGFFPLILGLQWSSNTCFYSNDLTFLMKRLSSTREYDYFVLESILLFQYV